MWWSACTRRRWAGSSGSSGRRLLPVREANGEGDHAKHGGGVSASRQGMAAGVILGQAAGSLGGEGAARADAASEWAAAVA